MQIFFAFIFAFGLYVINGLKYDINTSSLEEENNLQNALFL